MRFQSPIFFVFLAVIPLIWWRWVSPRRRSAIRFSTVDRFNQLGTTWATRARVILPILRTLGVTCLVVALARPQKGNELTRIYAEGIAIQMVVDVSGSMRAMDFVFDGRRHDRLDAVRRVFRRFVEGGQDLPGRENDLIGMITFARYADAKCPLTFDHANLIRILGQTQIVSDRSEDGTALGDAIALGVERLRQAKVSVAPAPGERETGQISSRVMIVLTDGRQNAGELDPVRAAEIAKALDIKIYTIGAGTKGYAPFPVRDFFGNTVLRQMAVDIDEETLDKVAKTTGGEYFRATDADSLERIYEQIDKLERTRTEERRYMEYVELATTGSSEDGAWRRLRPVPLLWIPMVLLVLEILLTNTRFRKLP